MSETGENQHQASERQRQKFLERGDIARSRELIGFAVFAAAAAALLGQGPALSQAAVESLRGTITSLDTHDMSQLLVTTKPWALAILGVLSACAASPLVAGVAQTGGQISWSMVGFDLERISWAKGFGRLFEFKRQLIDVVVGFAKVGLFAAVVLTVWQRFGVRLFTAESTQGRLWLAGEALEMLVIRLSLLWAAIAAADYGRQWFSLQQRMKMSDQDVREEQKEEGGDPQIRRARKRRYRELLKTRSMPKVAKADVVLVNPTHYAVALIYQSGTMRAPKVIAKGRDEQAQRIRDEARSAGVAIVSDPPLTRLLFKRVKVGREVPADLYQAVATVLAYVYRLRKRVA